MSEKTYIHVSREALSPGDRIEPGGLGRRLAGLRALPADRLPEFDRKVLFTEDAFESLRARHFPDRPSRLSCCYALADESELPALLAHIPELRAARVYRVRAENPGTRVFPADFTLRNTLLSNISIRQGTAKALDAAIRAYWRKPAARRIECLIDGPLLVMERLADNAADHARVPRGQTQGRKAASRIGTILPPKQTERDTMSPTPQKPAAKPAAAPAAAEQETALPALFADGLTEVTISAGIARITLYRLGRNNQRYNCADLLIPAVQLGSFSSQIASIAEQLADAQKRAQQSDRI